MSAALRLAQLQKEKGGEPLAIAVLEKAREIGAHMLSGAVLDPSTLKDLIPDFKAKGAPLAPRAWRALIPDLKARGPPPPTEAQRNNIYSLTRPGNPPLPITPPFF